MSRACWRSILLDSLGIVLMVGALAGAAGETPRVALRATPPADHAAVAGGDGPARTPPAGVLRPARSGRATFRSAGDPALPTFASGDLGDEVVRTARALPDAAPDLAAELRALLPLRGTRPAAAPQAAPGAVPAPERLPALAGLVADKLAPWSADHLLADPNHMNDQYVAAAASPVTGHLYAVFESTDLADTDRDIHIARSTDSGRTWQQWELPSSSLDEYHPDLAIDAAGYLYVVWIREDGMVMRSRSTSPDDPASWYWVKWLAVGEPCATPSIAVSGAGHFSTVFIATSWLTINWDWYDYEWTLLWMYSTNGGETVTYNYLVPDGYPDLWPDAELSGGTAYLVNGEQDPYSGEIEILLAVDAVSGDFWDTVNLTAWTPNNGGFPSLAAQGTDVYCVYQLDYDDGLGTLDGDVIYFFSWDGVATVYGPYAMTASTDDSVGPRIHTRDGVVGCLWLEAPPGGDEYVLMASQAPMYGDPSAWGALEQVSDEPHVEPIFRSAAGAVRTNALHAVWTDRRDFPAQGLNIYASERPVLPNLAPLTPAGWESPLVLSMVPGERTTGALGADQPVYVSFAFANLGLQDASADVTCELAVDGFAVGAWSVPGGMPMGAWAAVEDFPIEVSGGMHQVSFRLDTTGAVTESSETDNVHGDQFFFIEGVPALRVTPDAIRHEVAAPAAAATLSATLTTDPPLVRRVSLPVVDPRLAAGLETAGAVSGARLPVVIEPALRLDLAKVDDQLRLLSRRDRRAVGVAALAAQGVRDANLLASLCADLVADGEMSSPRSLWPAGTLRAEMSPAAVAQLSLRPEIGRLWLDDRLLETCATPAAGAAAPAADKALAWHLSRIGADQAWALGYDGTGVVVGILDTGAAYDHPDLAGHLWDGGTAYPHHGWDYSDGDDDPYDGDTGYYHGTHTAGLVVGDGTAGTTTGAAPGAQLMILRCVPGDYESLIESVIFCLEHGADLLSMSAGWSQAPADLRAAIREAAASLVTVGVPWICAAGNGDQTGGHYPAPTDIITPGDCPHPWFGDAGHTSVICVGATNASDQMYSWSSLGPTAWSITSTAGFDDYPHPPGLIKPDLVAPGEGIVSTWVPEDYTTFSGTSMATPLVAGAAAILMQANPDLSLEELARILEESATDLFAAGRDNSSGAGLLNIPAALGSVPQPESESFWVHNDGYLPLVVSGVGETAGWLEVSPAAATVAPGDSARFTATFLSDGLGQGLYQTPVTLSSNAADSPHVVWATLVVGDATGVEDGGPPPASVRPALVGYPNPFNPRTILRFALPAAGRARLALYDLRGREVRVLADAVLPAGQHEVIWDGTDDSGRTLASGTYLARLTGPAGLDARRKLMLVR